MPDVTIDTSAALGISIIVVGISTTVSIAICRLIGAILSWFQD